MKHRCDAPLIGWFTIKLFTMNDNKIRLAVLVYEDDTVLYMADEEANDWIEKANSAVAFANLHGVNPFKKNPVKDDRISLRELQDNINILCSGIKVEFKNLTFSQALDYSKKGRAIKNAAMTSWWRMDLNSIRQFTDEDKNRSDWMASKVYEYIKKYE